MHQLKHNVQTEINPRINSCWLNILKLNHLRGRKSCTITIDREKPFDITYHLLKIKTTSKTENNVGNIIPNDEIVKNSFLRSEKIQGFLLSLVLLII